MFVPIGAIILGLYCLLIVPKYRSVIGFRGVLYALQTKESWEMTNKVFGLFLLFSGIIYLFNPNIKLFIIFIIIGIFSTDLITFFFLNKKN